MPPLTSLRAFEAVARLGSLKAAGDALFVTLSAISHQIRNVEDWMGRPVFSREGDRTRLLPEGVDLARSLTVSLTTIEAACHRAWSSLSSPALVIAAIPSVAMCWLIPRLSGFRAAHPGVEIRVIYAMHGRDIDLRDVHLAFVFLVGPPVIPDVTAQALLAGQSIPVCSLGLLQSLGRAPESAEDFRGLDLLHDGDTSGWQAWLNDAGADTGSTFEDFNLLRAAALSGRGAALCPLAMVAPDLAAGRLVQLADREAGAGADYYLLSVTTGPPQILEQVEPLCNWALDERDQPLKGDLGQI